jgi:site-specific DNA-cytosine methylase
LIFEFTSVAAGARPKVVIAENVPALSTRYRDLFDRALDSLRFPEGAHGPRAYYASWTVLAADDFGVGQKRRRLFLVAVRADVGQAVGITTDDGVAVVFPRPSQPGCTVRQALAGLRQTDRDVRPWHQSSMGTSLGHFIRRLPKDPPKWFRLSDVEPGNTTKFTLKRCAWDMPAPTLTCTGQRPDGVTGILHPGEDRKFTLPELKRLTALPDDYVLTGTLAQACERVCRMVPPPVTRAIAERVYDRVLRRYVETS